MAHTILEFKNNHMIFTGDDLIVASMLILELNEEAVSVHFPTMRTAWFEAFSPAMPFMTDLHLTTFITEIKLEYEFLKMIENTCKYIESNTYDNIFYLSPIYCFLESTNFKIGRQYRSDFLIVALNGLKKLLL